MDRAVRGFETWLAAFLFFSFSFLLHPKKVKRVYERSTYLIIQYTLFFFYFSIYLVRHECTHTHTEI